MCQGRSAALRSGFAPPDHRHLVKLTLGMVPTREPGSPLPDLSVPLSVADLHVIVVPVLGSTSVSLPVTIETAPPGLTVQVAAGAASAAVEPMAKVAATPMTRIRA